MITPRRTAIVRVADLASLRATLIERVTTLAPERAADTCVLVPTHAAAEQLRRTIEDHVLTAQRPAIVWPRLVTRRDLYDEFEARLPGAERRLTSVEREVLFGAIARELVDHGVEPPFRLRPGLVTEMLALYDHVRRLGRGIDEFERNVTADLAREQDTDRGAARLLQQTRFLVAAYREYESQLGERTLADEHVLRARLLTEVAPTPIARLIVAVADRLAQPEGFWPADLDLLARVPGLASLEVVATEAMLASGFLERLHAALPDAVEERGATAPARVPRLVVPAAHGVGGTLLFSARDREEELIGVARRLKADRRDNRDVPLHRTALVVRRPLPYLYLARQVFADAGVPFEAWDALPLAAEPFAAAVDLVLDVVASDFARPSLLALVRAPHFTLTPDADAGLPIAGAAARAVTAFDTALADARYLGGLPRLRELVARFSGVEVPRSREERRQHGAAPLARAVLAAVEPLAVLGEERPLVDQAATLVAWLRRHSRAPQADDETRARRLRVRAAVLATLDGLSRAHARYDPAATTDVAGLTIAIRHGLGNQTLAIDNAGVGLQILDQHAARFGDFDDVQLLGLVDGEWPERVPANVLYPAALLQPLEPLPAIADPRRRERDSLAAARAAFRDLARSPAIALRASTFVLEQDAVVEPSVLADELGPLGLMIETREPPAARVTVSDALALTPRRADVGAPGVQVWARARLRADDRGTMTFRGHAGPWRPARISVSRLERYLDCPFRYFASEVLRLEEQPEDEDTRTPLERGRFLHELWERFFAEWQRRGHGRIAPPLLPEARALFETMCEEALATLAPTEAALERHRLLGSAVSAGIAHRVFSMEADLDEPIAERLLEFPIQGEFRFIARDGTTRVVPLSAKVDRVDVLRGGVLRVVDYKSKNTPDVKQALQLPIYSSLAREVLQAQRGGQWHLGEAMYVSFEGDKAITPLRAKGRSLDELVADAQARLLTTIDDITRGAFPASPARKSLCGPCSYRTVCRLEYVERQEPADE